MYRQGDRLMLVTTDRLSAFDRVLTTIPFKGEVLNRLATFWFEKTKHVVPNHVLDVPDPERHGGARAASRSRSRWWCAATSRAACGATTRRARTRPTGCPSPPG